MFYTTISDEPNVSNNNIYYRKKIKTFYDKTKLLQFLFLFSFVQTFRTYILPFCRFATRQHPNHCPPVLGNGLPGENGRGTGASS